MCKDELANCSDIYKRFCNPEEYPLRWARKKCAKTCGFCDINNSLSTLPIPTKVVLSPTTSQSTPPETDDTLGTLVIAVIIGCIITVLFVTICILCVVLNRKNRQSKKTTQGVNYAIIDESVTVATSSVSQYEEIEESATWTEDLITGATRNECGNKYHGFTERCQAKDEFYDGVKIKMAKTDSVKTCQLKRNLSNEYDRINRNDVILDIDDCQIQSGCSGENPKKMWNTYDHVSAQFDVHDQSQYSHIKTELPETSAPMTSSNSSELTYFILEKSEEKS